MLEGMPLLTVSGFDGLVGTTDKAGESFVGTTIKKRHESHHKLF